MGGDLLPGSAKGELLARLRDVMTRGGLFSGVNLLFRVGAGRVDIDMMASSSDALGVLLATICDPAELDDPGSLSRRVSSGGRQEAPEAWRYGLAVGRYLTADRGLCLQMTLSMPAADLPEVVSRLSARL